MTAPDRGRGRHARCPSDRRASTNPTGSSRRRRMANSSAEAVGRSSHWTSSTTSSTGPMRERSRRRVRKAVETAPRSSVASGSSRSSATAKARRWGGGKPPCRVIVTRVRAGPEAQRTTASTRDPRVRSGARRSIGFRRIDRRVQQGALPDTGASLDDESARPCMNIRDESLQRFELGLPSDDPLDAVRRGLVPPCSQQRNRLEPASGGHGHPKAVLAGRATRITFPATRRRSRWPNGEGGA